MNFYTLYSWSFVRKESLKVFLALLGIVLGISVYGAMRLANERVIHDFSKTADLLAGKSEYQIRSKIGPLDEELFRELKKIKGVSYLSPKSEGVVSLYGDGELIGAYKVVGVDLLANNEIGYWDETDVEEIDIKPLLQYRAALINETAFNTLKNRKISLEIDGAVQEISELMKLPEQGIAQAHGGTVLVVDISYFQELFQEFGVVHSFDVFIGNKNNREDVVAAIEEVLPSGKFIEAVTDREVKFERMTRAFRLNLNFLAGISLLVALLLIYNTSSYLTLKRRKDFGVLLSIGMTPRPLFLFLLGEGLLLGLVGTTIGVFGAYFLAEYTTEAIALTISALYTESEVATRVFSPQVLGELYLFGPLITLLGVAIPASEVFSYKIRETFYYENVESRFRSWLVVITLFGLLALLFAFLTARSELLKISLLMGFLSPAFLSIAAIFLSPIVLVLSVKLLRLLSKKIFGIEAELALDHLWMRLRRNGVVVASIALSLGMFIGVSIMISSFRATVSTWLEDVIHADIFISLPSEFSNRSTELLPKSFVAQVANHPDVRLLNTTTSVEVPFRDRSVLLRGESFRTLQETGAIALEENLSREQRRELLRERSILVSEAFVNKYDLGVGETLSIELPGGTLVGEISAVFTDYVSEHGVILIEQEWFQELSGLESVHGLGVYLRDGVRSDSIIPMIQEFDRERNFLIRDNDSLREEVFRVFDNTFQITYALQAISLFISSLVLLNALFMLLLERKREFMSFRAIGASMSSLMKMVVYESTFLGLISALWGSLVGISFSVLLVFVINSHFFGWSVQFLLPYSIVFQTLLAVFILSALLGVVVAYLSFREIDVKVLRYE